MDGKKSQLFDRSKKSENRKDATLSLLEAVMYGALQIDEEITFVEDMLKNGADPNVKIHADEAQTLLHVAVRKNNLKMVELLVRHGATVDSSTTDDETPLSLALKHDIEDIVIFLLNADPCIKSKNDYSENLKTSLHTAAEIGNLKAVEYFLNKGANINARTVSGETPLYFACENNHAKTVSFLLRNNADIDLKTSTKASSKGLGETLLHRAVMRRFLKIVQLLCESGADVDAKFIDKTPLHLACAPNHVNDIFYLPFLDIDPNLERHDSEALEVTKVLCEYGACVNAQDNFGKTPLHYASRGVSVEILGYLLSAKANPNIKTLKGETALHFATEDGCLTAVELLFESGANVNAQTDNGYTPLHYASTQGHTEIVCYLLSKNAHPDFENKFGETSAHLAAKKGHFKEIEVLTQGRCDINAKTRDGRTAFDLAWENNHTNVIDYIQKFTGSKMEGLDIEIKHFTTAGDWLKVVELISGSGAIINAQTKTFQSLFHLACKEGQVEVVRLLLSKNADPNFEIDDSGKTPLHVAAEEGHLQIIELLSKHGAYDNALSNNSATPLVLACKNNKLDSVKYLLNNRADLDFLSQNVTIESAFHGAVGCGNLALVELLVKYGADVNVKNLNGEMPLHIACASNKTSIEIIKYLLDNKADFNAVTLKNETPLHFAVKHESFEKVELLIKKGANVNVPNNSGETPLFRSSQLFRDVNVLPFLLMNNADPNIKNTDGETPLHNVVTQKPSIKPLELLILNGADVNAQNAYGMTALYLASTISDPKKNAERVGCLLRNGADPNIRGPNRETALYSAVNTACLKSVKLLVERGADVNAQTKNGSTPLYLATKKYFGQIIEYLLHNNADPNISKHSNVTPLHVAVNRRFFKIVQLLLRNHANINVQTKNGLTPLHVATENNHADVVGYLLSNNADPNTETVSARTALHLAVEEGFSNVVELLLKNHAKVNVVDVNGFFPLQSAAFRGDVDTVKLLVEFDANIDAESENRKYTAFQYASTKGNDEVAQVLLESGCDINTKGFRDALNSRHNQISQLCRRHIIKLKAAKLCDVEHFEQEIKEKEEDKEKINFENPDLDNLQRNCEGEFEKMCSVQLSLQTDGDGEALDDFSLYDILANRNNPAYVKTDYVVQALEEIDFSTFPNYGGFILNSFKRNKRRNELLILGQEALSVLLNTATALNNKLKVPPFEIMEHILTFLSTDDLKSLIRCSGNLKFQFTKR